MSVSSATQLHSFGAPPQTDCYNVEPSVDGDTWTVTTSDGVVFGMVTVDGCSVSHSCCSAPGDKTDTSVDESCLCSSEGSLSSSSPSSIHRCRSFSKLSCSADMLWSGNRTPSPRLKIGESKVITMTSIRKKQQYSNTYKGPFKRMQHFGATSSNTVGHNMLSSFEYHVWNTLGDVGSCWTM